MGLKIDLTSHDTTLNLLPCFHTGGLNLLTNPTFHVGGTAIIQRGFEPTETLRLLSTHATAFFGVPAIYLFLSQHPGLRPHRPVAGRARGAAAARRSQPAARNSTQARASTFVSASA